MKILAIDTASGQCSVALQVNGEVISRSTLTAREHARLILPMVDALLSEAGIALVALDAIAFGRGPGSFTGLRIAAGVAQGLALGAGIQVLPVSDLRALAELARRNLASAHAGMHAGTALACMDARMGEVYWGLFDYPAGLPPEESAFEQVSAPGVPAACGSRVTLAAGRGLETYPMIAAALGLQPDQCLAQAEPHAEDIVRLAAFDLGAGRSLLPPEAAQPVYLRDQVTNIAIKPPL
jgi:tRNA threonylcarbamoyladenosine biosynthesis protein TsaB